MSCSRRRRGEIVGGVGVGGRRGAGIEDVGVWKVVAGVDVVGVRAGAVIVEERVESAGVVAMYCSRRRRGIGVEGVDVDVEEAEVGVID